MPLRWIEEAEARQVLALALAEAPPPAPAPAGGEALARWVAWFRRRLLERDEV